MESLPVMPQLTPLLFSIALALYLLDIDISAAKVVGNPRTWLARGAISGYALIRQQAP